MTVENIFSQLGNHVYMQIYFNLSPRPESFVLAKWSSFPVCLRTVDRYYCKPLLLQDCPFLPQHAGICCSSHWQHNPQSKSNLLTFAILLVYSPGSNFILIYLWLLKPQFLSSQGQAVYLARAELREHHPSLGTRRVSLIPVQRCPRGGWADPPTPSNKQWAALWEQEAGLCTPWDTLLASPRAARVGN